jgi:hypothetical protein
MLQWTFFYSGLITYILQKNIQIHWTISSQTIWNNTSMGMKGYTRPFSLHISIVLTLYSNFHRMKLTVY